MTSHFIALSGGMDSVVLLHFLHKTFPALNISAIHVNHQLLPEAKDFEKHCKIICKQWKIPLKVVRVNIEKKPRESLEAKARTARYDVFKKILKKDDILLMAHHLDDQAETFLFQVLRGAGLKGASAMPAISALGKGFLVRPLLSFSRESLSNYARYHQLEWINDPSNIDTQFDRNYLRHEIFPLLKSRWPEVSKIFARFSEHCAEQEKLLQQLAKTEAATCQGKYLNTLYIPKLMAFSLTQQKNILRHFMQENNLRPPSEKILAEILNMCAARSDKNPQVSWANTKCMRYQSHLFLLPFEARRNAKLTKEEKNWCKTHLKNLRGYTIKFRQGGERFKPKNSKYTRTLKNLFQEWKIPPWLRDSIPLLYHNDTLVAVVGYAKA
jgi:tRNA(Ile)-lysidine synthase